MEVVIKTFFHERVVKTKEELKTAYHTMMDGASNVPRGVRPEFYYNHHIISGITYYEFLNILEEEKEC